MHVIPGDYICTFSGQIKIDVRAVLYVHYSEEMGFKLRKLKGRFAVEVLRYDQGTQVRDRTKRGKHYDNSEISKRYYDEA